MDIIGIPGGGFASNVFILKGSSNIIVDAGLLIDAEQVIKTVRDEGLNIDGMILTHRHIDHVEGAPYISKELDIPLYASEAAAAPLREGDSVTTGALLFGGTLEKMEVLPIKQAPLGDEWEVLHTPGHSEGSVCLFSPADGILISGDTVFCDGGVGRWDLPTGSLTKLTESLRTLQDLPVKGLYPGHGRWVEIGGETHIKMAMSSLGGYL